jgi:two-component system phosphate regulon sensor histidine kinase PhoR
MIRPQRYFPWKLARQMFFSQLIFFTVTLLLAGIALHHYASSIFLQGRPPADLLRQAELDQFDQVLNWAFLIIMIAASLYLALNARFFARPLGHLLQRARELRRIDTPIDETILSSAADATGANDNEDDAEPGEWLNLERALNRIHRDLRLRTQAREQEREELSTLIGAVSDAILAVDRSGLPLFFNLQFSGLFPVPQGSERPLRLDEMFRAPEILEGFQTVLRSGERGVITTTMHTARHSVARHFSVSIAPLRAQDSHLVYGAIAVFHDVTELKQSEQIRIEFVGNASHELRTPLTSIKGYVETLKDDLQTGRLDSASQFLNIISRNVDRLIFLVNDLLDLSVIESSAEPVKSSVSTRELTDGALRQLEEKRAAKNQEIIVRFDSEECHGDPRRVEQVLVNLIHNAIKYVPERKRIDVIWQKEARGTSLHVKDNGPGISLDHQARLFERFYRVDTGRSREQGGTGLGLAIVKHIMLKHGGTVRLISSPGHGAEFICTFPD